jgi:hypothetical protein
MYLRSFLFSSIQFSEEAQGCTLVSVLFNIFISDLSLEINDSKFLLFADDWNIHRRIQSVEDCKSVQADVDWLQSRSGENCVELYNQKNKLPFFTPKTNSIHLNYNIRNVLILRSDSIKNLGIILDTNLHFHGHFNFIRSQAQIALGFIRCITYTFCP